MRFLIMLALSILAIVLVVVTKPEQQASLTELAPSRVVVTQVERQLLQPEVELSGQLQPSARALLHIEVAGRLAERLVEPGAVVAQGEPLLRLEAGDYRDGVELARAALAQEQAAAKRDRQLLQLARKNRELAEADVQRQVELGSSALASLAMQESARQRQLQLAQEEARAAYAVATTESRLAQRRAELSRAERNLERCELRAPFAGRVNRVEAQPGDYLTSNQLALELVATEQLDLYTEVRGEVAVALELGQSVEVSIGAQRISGELVALQPDSDPLTHTHALRIRLPGEGLRPGQLARATLLLPSRSQALMVPITALLQEDGGAWLYRLGEGNLLQRQAVVLGTRINGSVEILSGIAQGDRIVARNVAALADSQQVVVVDTTSGE